MYSRLYNKVFGGDNSSFDANENFYTLILNFAGKAEYYEPLKSAMGHYICRNSCEEQMFDLSEVGDNGIGDYMRSRMSNNFGRNINTLYVMMFDYSDRDISAEISQATKSVYGSGAVNNGDRVVITLTVPEENGSACLASLGRQPFPENVNFFMFEKSKYTMPKLVDSIIGAILLNSIKSLCSRCMSNVAQTDQIVRNNVSSFPENGKAWVATQPNYFWSTLAAVYNDDKMDFLRYYLLKLYSHAEDFSHFDLADACNTFFATQVDITDKVALKRRLEYAIRQIPKVTGTKPLSQTSLQTYFNTCYDRDCYSGDKVVELTLKVNLCRVQIYTQKTVVDAAQMLFENGAQYHSSDIYREIVASLNAYLQRHGNDLKLRYEDLGRFISTDNDVERDLPEYIERYISYDSELKKQEFWGQVFLFIQRNRDNFEQYCAESKALAAKLDSGLRELALQDEVYLGTDSFPSYSAKTLFCADTSPQICENIKIAYERFVEVRGDQSKPNTENRVAIGKCFNVNPSFFCDYSYDFTVGGTFSVRIAQRIGKYFIFGAN